MFTVNNIQDSSGKPIRTLAYSPYMAMMINPWSALEKYSDETTDTDGVGTPDANNITYAAASSNATMGIPQGIVDLYKVSNATLDDFFSYSNQTISNNGYKYYKFLNFFTKYRAFKKLSYYSYLKEPTFIDTRATTVTINDYPRILKIDSTKFVRFFSTGTSNLSARAGTIATDGTITWGSTVVITSSMLASDKYHFSLIATDKFVVVHRGGGSNYAGATVCTLSGTTITVGTFVQAEAHTYGNYAYCCKLDTDKFAMIYYRGTDSTWYMNVATVSGTVPTFGTATTITSMAAGSTYYFGGMAQITTNAFVFTRTLSTDTSVKAVACTVSGTVVTEGTATVVHSTASYNTTNHAYESLKMVDTNKFLVFIARTSSSNIGVVTFSVSGTTVTANTELYTTINSTIPSPYTQIYEHTATSKYIVYGLNWALQISISGGTTTVDWTDYKILLTAAGSGRFSTNVSATGFDDVAQFSTYFNTSYSGIGIVGDYIIAFGASSATQVQWYMVAHRTATFEAYNDGTIIGTAFTNTYPFIITVQDIQSSIMNKNAYLKIKNTTGSARAMFIESVFCEVD